jgi:gliding motility-associated-like protein
MNSHLLTAYKSISFFIALFVCVVITIAQPVINGFTPATASAGATVTISGTNFNTTPNNNTVLFGAAKAIVLSASTNMLAVKVPVGATFGRITVTSNGFTAFSNTFFTVITGETLTAASFITRIDFGTGNSPSLFARGDLNDDGRPDMAVSNFFSNSISVFVNSSTPGTVAFATPLILATGPNPEGIRIVDINSDGKQDIILTNIANYFSVFLNTSTSSVLTLAPRVDVPLPAVNVAPRGIHAADFDGDGKPDVATADNNKRIDFSNNTSFGTISISRNNGNIGNLSFAAPDEYKTGEYPRGIFAADLDGDLKPDLAVSNHVTPSVSLFLNNSTPGSINFTPQTDLTIGGRGEQINIADIDGDGKKDILVSVLFGSGGVHVFRNISIAGSIRFASPLNILSGGPLDIGVGDIDGDGKPDMAIANVSTGKVSVYKNLSTPGNISFATKMDYSGAANGESLVGVAIGDVDGDLFPDLTVTNSNANLVTVLRMAAKLPDPPKVNLGADTSICTGDSLVLIATNTNAQYRWSTGAITDRITVKQTGTYWVEVTNNGGTVADTLNLFVKPIPVISLGNDELLCKGNSKQLTAFTNAANYLWSNGATSSNITINKAGTYSVIVDVAGCVAKDTVIITYDSVPVFTLGTDAFLCRGQQLVLHSPITNANQQWYNGSVADTLIVTTAGTYSLTISNSCGTSTDNIQIEEGNCNVYVPNAFTPDKNNLNDTFKPILQGQPISYRFEIFDRWGTLVFNTTDPAKGWDGKVKGISVDSNTLFVWQCWYQLTGSKPGYQKGTVLLMK